MDSRRALRQAPVDLAHEGAQGRQCADGGENGAEDGETLALGGRRRGTPGAAGGGSGLAGGIGAAGLGTGLISAAGALFPLDVIGVTAGTAAALPITQEPADEQDEANGGAGQQQDHGDDPIDEVAVIVVLVVQGYSLPCMPLSYRSGGKNPWIFPIIFLKVP